MKDQLLYVQSQSMRNNLLFSNITESEGESPVDSEQILRDFMIEKLKMAQDMVNQIKFERVHRMGQKQDQPAYSRMIVAKFCNYKDREIVRKQSSNLSSTNYYISEQFPKEIVARRKSLIPQLKAAKQQGKSAWLSYDRLYINGRPVQTDSF